MLPEYYDQFKREYDETLAKLLEEFDSWNAEGHDVESLVAYQQAIIDVCTEMENSWLTSADEIVGGFEQICELLYELSNGRTEAAEDIRIKLRDMHSLFDKCIDRSERKLSLVLMERNEERYLKEWLEFHLMMGADHFYVYDHGSTDGSIEVLQPYVDKGLVELFPVEGEYLPTQISVYNDALKRAKYSTRYLAFIDTDEFLTPMRHETALAAIEDIFRSYEETPFKSPGSCRAGGIGVNWRVYGTSGHKTPAAGPVISEYTHRGPDDLMMNCHVKTICKPLTVRTQVHLVLELNTNLCLRKTVRSQ